MKSTLVRFSKCIDCPHLSKLGAFCNFKGVQVPSIFTIPDWCPLPDSEESTESQTRSV